MHAGLLLYDGSNNNISKKINDAVAYHERKIGTSPNLCLVHYSMLTEKQMEIGFVTVRPYEHIPPGHIWIGIEDKEK